MNKAISTKQAAEFLGVSVRTLLERLRHEQGFPEPFDIGRSLTWDAQELADWRESRRVSARVSPRRDGSTAGSSLCLGGQPSSPIPLHPVSRQGG